MTIYINPMSQFPYDVNRREGTYFDRNHKRVDKEIIKDHFCVAYEGKDIRLSTWASKQSKELTNLATYFEGNTTDEKRQIIWHQIQTRTVNKHLINFCEEFREEPLFLWYLSNHDLPTTQFIKRFLQWYWKQS